MEGERHPARLAVTETRERVLEQLSDAFARDELGLDELESRVDRAYRATTEVGLRALVTDLSAAASATSSALVAASQDPRRALAEVGARATRVLAVLGNVERRGHFQVLNGYRATSVLGNIELDLRDVVFPEGVTQIHVRAVLGNVEIVVPPQLPVECEGVGILASFAALNRLPPEGVATGPVLRIVGSAVLGNVEVRTRPRTVSPSRAPLNALPPKRGEEP